MNYRLVSKYLGQFLLVYLLLMVPSALWAVWFREWNSLVAFGESLVLGFVVGLALMAFGRKARNQLFQRESLGLVGLGWLLAAAVGALPYVFSETLNYVDAYFETMSGLTTTGSTVIADIEAVDKSILFWRSFTHWIGGMGIIVLFIAVLPYLGAGGKQLFKSEAPGPDPHGLSPRIKDTASMLWKIYLGLTVLQTLLLMWADMSFYDALCHTFGTLATGGFSTKQASVGFFDSILVESIIIFFMIIAGTNFGLFFIMLRGDWKAIFRDSEWRAYLLIMVAATVLITVNLMGVPGPAALDETDAAAPQYSLGEAVRHASFLVVSIMTTTGFGTENFEVWPYFSQLLLVVLMFVGGCAGSTGGGVKVIRVVLLVKMVFWRLENTFRPKTVRPIRFNGQIVDNELQRRIITFMMLHAFILVAGSLFMAGLGLPLVTAVTSVVATLNNIGPGLEFVGAAHDFSMVPDVGKVFLSLCMAMGRLELFSICVLFLPGFWKHS